jgi:hypothetical protein
MMIIGSLSHSLFSKYLRIDLILNKGIIAIAKINSTCLDALRKLWSFKAIRYLRTVVEASNERIVNRRLVVVDSLWPD